MSSLSDFYRGKKVLVTGGAGLIGSAFVEQLLAAGACVYAVQHRRPIPFGGSVERLEGNLLDAAVCREIARGMDCVIHAAAVSGGSKEVTLRAIPMFTDNLLMNTQLLEAARLAGVGHYLFISNSSVYAKSDAPLHEEDAWGETSRGIPENETGMVKRASETQCGLYARTTDMRIAIIRGGNAYGPHDNFDLEASHVVPALIRKAIERQNPYAVWGSGKMVRDFIHTRDLARGGLFLLARAQPGACAPINIATGRTVTIEELVSLILDLADHADARIQLDPGAPPTSPAKRIDVTKMRELGFRPELSLEDGLRQTIDWYRQNARGARQIA